MADMNFIQEIERKTKKSGNDSNLRDFHSKGFCSHGNGTDNNIF